MDDSIFKKNLFLLLDSLLSLTSASVVETAEKYSRQILSIDVTHSFVHLE
jgi:hypothetical protein